MRWSLSAMVATDEACNRRKGTHLYINKLQARTKLVRNTLEIIITILTDDPFRTIQDCQTAKESRTTLQTRYASKYMINRLSVLNILLNSKLTAKEYMAEHISTCETLHARLAVMKTPVQKAIKIALLISSLSNLYEYKPVIALFNTMREDLAARNPVTMLFVGEWQRPTQQADMNVLEHVILVVSTKRETTWNKPFYTDTGTKIRCLRWNKNWSQNVW